MLLLEIRPLSIWFQKATKYAFNKNLNRPPLGAVCWLTFADFYLSRIYYFSEKNIIFTDEQQSRRFVVAIGSDTQVMNDSILRLGLLYRLTKPAAAVYQGEGKPLCLHLAVGSLVQLASCAYDQGRLIDVLHQGRVLVMFVEDVLKGELVEFETTEKSDGFSWQGDIQ
jgi:hypothetical protein